MLLGDNTGGRGGKAAVDEDSASYSLDFNWTPLHILTQLAVCVYNSELHRAFRDVTTALSRRGLSLLYMLYIQL